MHRRPVLTGCSQCLPTTFVTADCCLNSRPRGKASATSRYFDLGDQSADTARRRRDLVSRALSITRARRTRRSASRNRAATMSSCSNTPLRSRRRSTACTSTSNGPSGTDNTVVGAIRSAISSPSGVLATSSTAAEASRTAEVPTRRRRKDGREPRPPSPMHGPGLRAKLIEPCRRARSDLLIREPVVNDVEHRRIGDPRRVTHDQKSTRSAHARSASHR